MSMEFTQEIIDQYLSKQLKGETLDAFNEKMNQDEVFKKEIETQAFIHRGVNKFGEDEMRSKLKKIRAEVLKDNSSEQEEQSAAKVVSLGKKKRTRPVLRWSMAAAITLAIGAAVYIVANNQTMSSQDLFANYYQPYTEDISVRNVVAEDIAHQASQFYKSKNYKSALPLFLKILDSEPDNAEVQIAAGICQLELGKFDKANQTFSAVVNPLFKEQAQWYLGMNFLKRSDMENAKTILEGIKEGDYKYEKAQEILEKI